MVFYGGLDWLLAGVHAFCFILLLGTLISYFCMNNSAAFGGFMAFSFGPASFISAS
jgi:hypothetical protein